MEVWYEVRQLIWSEARVPLGTLCYATRLKVEDLEITSEAQIGGPNVVAHFEKALTEVSDQLDAFSSDKMVVVG